MSAIVSDAAPSTPSIAAPTSHRVRSVLAIPAFRRLWAVTAVSATGDWLSLLALTSLATQLTNGYSAQSFALGGVVATKLLPALLGGAFAGALADRFDRRRVMVTCDILRFGLFVSIPIVGSLWWLFAATFLIEVCAMFWIPAKDAAVPNLLRRPDQVETANQLALVMTYGVAVLLASGLFTIISSSGSLFAGSSPITTVYVALMLNGCAYLLTAATVWFFIKEISGRTGPRAQGDKPPGLLALLKDGFTFVVSTPLVRGLVIGIIGAFTAGGAVIATAKLYSASLGGGDASYSLLFTAVFIGLAIGMGAAPRLARRLPHNRLFGTAIVAAGFALCLVALAPHLVVALLTVALVGAFAGIAFLTGLTIIGSQVADEVRGRVVAFVQSLVRLVLLGAMSVVPLLVGVVASRTVDLFGREFQIDGTRLVLFGGGLVAAVVGSFAYRQMDDRRLEPLLPDLLAALRRGDRRHSGVLIAVEGATPAETADQTNRLAESLRAQGHTVVVPSDGESESARWVTAMRDVEFSGARAQALAAAALRADLVERVVRPALADGAVVVMDRFVASPLVQFGVVADRMNAELGAGELESLAVWATGRLRPDVSVLLDRAPATGEDPAPKTPPGVAGEEHVRVQRLLTRMAAAEPHRYVVVDADGEPAEVAARVAAGLAPVLKPAAGRAPDDALVGPPEERIEAAGEPEVRP
ncbi:bifunctional MFS transporter/dTMP kinase [Pseudonocardia sp. T1-2H]|uniref:bifunctional MFS transporter/dTMP kinase n=1 Tax=Pseudonocardia sp. T1-2H TaxID=3128899 RepID=UPI0031014BA7